MAVSLQPQTLRRYKDLAMLLARYARPGAVRASHDDADVRAERFAEELEEMGPTFVKLGQLLSTRADLLPAVWLDALARLQDRVAPFPAEEAERIVSTELGVRISKAFSSFDPEPMAAASLAQVHRAVTRDGRAVAVKIQRPGIRERILEEMEALEHVVELLDATEAGYRYRVMETLEEFRRALMRELDFRTEADNLEVLADNLREFEHVLVPRPLRDYSTDRVLTMDLVQGRKVTAVGPLTRLELDGRALVVDLFRAYLKQILVDGFFHADPHPGNVFLTDDHRLALVDLGMTSRISPAIQEHLMRLLLAVAEGRGEEAAEGVVRMSELMEPHDTQAFRREVADLVLQSHGQELADRQVGRQMLEMVRLAARHGVRTPRQLIMLGKTLLNLDEVARILDPTFDPNEALRDHAAELMQRRLRQSFTPAGVVESVLELNDFVQRLPARLNRLVNGLTEHGLEVKIRTLDVRHFITGMQHIANRITLGLVIAALLVGASMLVRVETRWTILGYPGLAILLFLAAALAGLVLVVSILRRDL